MELSCVSGNGFPQPYAQIVVAEDLRDHLSEPSTKKEVEDALGALLDRVNASLEHHEKLQFMVVVSDEWSIANGFLTPTMKIRRTAIEDASEANVDGWYNAGKPIVWA